MRDNQVRTIAASKYQCEYDGYGGDIWKNHQTWLSRDKGDKIGVSRLQCTMPPLHINFTIPFFASGNPTRLRGRAGNAFL